jgi:putative spermidine/putrescine transport system substrate-binding protein
VSGVRIALAAACVVALSIPAAGVGSHAAQPVPTGEGSLDLLQWPGYSDPSFARTFERNTGCRINRTTVASSADFGRLLKARRFDLASASGDVTGTLIAEGLVRPLDLARVPAWRQLAPPLRSPAFNTVGGKHYGVTVLWTPSTLLYHRTRARPAPVTWRAIYDARFSGKVSIPDNPMVIADAAIYLKATRPSYKIVDPYELTPGQFDAAVALLRRQRPLVRRYWQFASEQIQDFRDGAAVVGTSWPYQAQVLKTSNVPVRAFVPKEGASAWADSWMLSAKAAHPNCAYRWLQYVLTAPVQATEALVLRESPSNPSACKLMDAAEVGLCTAYHASAPPALMRRLSFWRTPTVRCGFRGRTDCVPYTAWQKAWTKIKGE